MLLARNLRWRVCKNSLLLRPAKAGGGWPRRGRVPAGLRWPERLIRRAFPPGCFAARARGQKGLGSGGAFCERQALDFPVKLLGNGHCVMWKSCPMLFLSPAIRRCVSSYRAIISYQSSEHMKHRTQGRSSSNNKNPSSCTLSRSTFFSFPQLLPDLLEVTGCIVKVRPRDSRLSSPSSLHQTTWMFTTTKVRIILFQIVVSLRGLCVCVCVLFTAAL